MVRRVSGGSKEMPIEATVGLPGQQASSFQERMDPLQGCKVSPVAYFKGALPIPPPIPCSPLEHLDG